MNQTLECQDEQHQDCPFEIIQNTDELGNVYNDTEGWGRCECACHAI